MNTDYSYMNKSLEKAVIDLKPSFFDIIILGQRIEDALTKLIEEEQDLGTKQYLMDFSSRVNSTLKNTFQSVQELTANAKELDSHTKELSLFDANIVQNIFKSIKEAEKDDAIEKTNSIEDNKQNNIEDISVNENQNSFSNQVEQEKNQLENQENLLDKINSIYEQEAQKNFDISPNTDIQAFEPVTPNENNHELTEMEKNILAPEKIVKDQSEQMTEDNLQENESYIVDENQDNNSFLQQQEPIDYTKNNLENDGMNLPYPIESDNIKQEETGAQQITNYDGFVGEYSDNNYFNSENDMQNNPQYSYEQSYNQNLEPNNQMYNQDFNWNNDTTNSNGYSNEVAFPNQESYQENYNENITSMNNEAGGQEINWNNGMTNSNEYSDGAVYPEQGIYQENYSENMTPLNNETGGEEINWNNAVTNSNGYSEMIPFPNQESYQENYNENIVSHQEGGEELNSNGDNSTIEYNYDNNTSLTQDVDNESNIENNNLPEQDTVKPIDNTKEEMNQDNNIGRVESILKSSKEEGKAIIVTDSQYKNLADSLESQEKLLQGKIIKNDILENTKKVLNNLLNKETIVPSNGETYYVEAENSMQDEPIHNDFINNDSSNSIYPQVYEEQSNEELQSMVQQSVNSNYTTESQPISQQPIVPESVEKMLENAKELYDAGYTKEANDLYEKISNMNQSQKEMQYVKVA